MDIRHFSFNAAIFESFASTSCCSSFMRDVISSNACPSSLSSGGAIPLVYSCSLICFSNFLGIKLKRSLTARWSNAKCSSAMMFKLLAMIFQTFTRSLILVLNLQCTHNNISQQSSSHFSFVQTMILQQKNHSQELVKNQT